MRFTIVFLCLFLFGISFSDASAFEITVVDYLKIDGVSYLIFDGDQSSALSIRSHSGVVLCDENQELPANLQRISIYPKEKHYAYGKIVYVSLKNFYKLTADIKFFYFRYVNNKIIDKVLSGNSEANMECARNLMHEYIAAGAFIAKDQANFPLFPYSLTYYNANQKKISSLVYKASLPD